MLRLLTCIISQYISILHLHDYFYVSLALPTTIEQWKEQFTETFEDILAGNVTISTSTTVSSTESRMQNDNRQISVKIADFPTFNGRHETWYSFRKEFEATTAMFFGTNDVLNCTDIIEHENKRKTNSSYDRNVRDLYAILKKKTSRGGALNKITKYESTQDGTLAWRYLKEYYDQEGDKDLYRTKCLNDLVNRCKLEYNSQGGMDAYISEFERICDLLEECGHGLDDTVKKTFFLTNVHDRAYESMKDICKAEGKTYNECVMLMRTKAIEISKATGPARKFNRNLNKKQIKGNDSDKEDDDRSNKSGDNPMYIPRKAWMNMTPKNREFWLKIRNEQDDNEKEKSNPEKPMYNKQYSGNQNRKINKMSSDRDDDEEQEHRERKETSRR